MPAKTRMPPWLMSLARPLVMRVLALRETMSRMGRLSLYRCQRLNTALSCPSLALVCVAMREIIVRFVRRMEVTEVLVGTTDKSFTVDMFCYGNFGWKSFGWKSFGWKSRPLGLRY
jgi:hypothetical protein